MTSGDSGDSGDTQIYMNRLPELPRKISEEPEECPQCHTTHKTVETLKKENKILFEEYDENAPITPRDIEICSISQIPLPRIINNLYKKNPKSDRWSCWNCKTTGDKWFMMLHLCKGSDDNPINDPINEEEAQSNFNLESKRRQEEPEILSLSPYHLEGPFLSESKNPKDALIVIEWLTHMTKIPIQRAV